MHSFMEIWVPLYGSVFVALSPHFCSATLFRMCICISTCIYVHLTGHIWAPTSYGIVWWKLGCPCLSHCVCVSQSPWLWSHTLFRMCTCISTCIYVQPYSPYLAQPPMYSYMENLAAPVWQCVCGQSPHVLWSDTLFRMCTCISTWIYVHLTVHHLVHPLCILW